MIALALADSCPASSESQILGSLLDPPHSQSRTCAPPALHPESASPSPPYSQESHSSGSRPRSHCTTWLAQCTLQAQDRRSRCISLSPETCSGVPCQERTCKPRVRCSYQHHTNKAPGMIHCPRAKKDPRCHPMLVDDIDQRAHIATLDVDLYNIAVLLGKGEPLPIPGTAVRLCLTSPSSKSTYAHIYVHTRAQLPARILRSGQADPRNDCSLPNSHMLHLDNCRGCRTSSSPSQGCSPH